MGNQIQNDVFFISDKIEWENIGGGVSRQIMGYDDKVMMVKVKFEKGSIGSPHNHFHSQTTYVASGKFEFTVGTDRKVVVPGDALYMEPDIVHSVLCIEEGILVDVFSPARQDFLDGSKLSYFENRK